MNRINLTDGELAALAARIQRNYDYDAKSGKLVNRKTGKQVRGLFRTAQKGTYQRFDFRFGGEKKHLNYHWAVWAWHHGCFPTKQLDHIDLDPTNNRIENLREVNASENNMNMLYPWKPNKDTGLPGVWKDHGGCRIVVGPNRYHFRDKYEAFCHLTLLGRRFK